MVDLSIIIPSYNTKDLLLKCLESLQQCNKEIIVVDNGSEDGTVEEMQNAKCKMQNVNSKFKIIENKQNFGFAKALNQCLKEASGKYILLLNSDTIVEKGAIEKMVGYLKINPQVGVVGCQLRNSDGSIQFSGGYLPNLINLTFWALFLDDLPLIKQVFPAYHVTDNFFYTKKKHSGWVTGAFFMTKKEVVGKVGLFDEKMFMYVEEVDWCQRVKNSGCKVIFNPAGFITHYKGASAKKNEAGLPAEALAKAGVIEEFQGLKYFFKKHKAVWQYPILRMLLKIGALGRKLFFGIILQDKKMDQIYEKAFKLV